MASQSRDEAQPRKLPAGQGRKGKELRTPHWKQPPLRAVTPQLHPAAETKQTAGAGAQCGGAALLFFPERMMGRETVTRLATSPPKAGGESRSLETLT